MAIQGGIGVDLTARDLSGPAFQSMEQKLKRLQDQTQGMSAAMGAAAGPAGDPALGYLIGEDVDYLGESADILGDGPDHVAVNYPTAVKVFPQGDGTPGLKYWAGDITITSIQRQAAVDGKILVSLSFKGTGALTRETVS